jgi:hypothetical protein
MKQKTNKKSYKKHQFKPNDYCLTCKQKKSCGVLDQKKPTVALATGKF